MLHQPACLPELESVRRDLFVLSKIASRQVDLTKNRCCDFDSFVILLETDQAVFGAPRDLLFGDHGRPWSYTGGGPRGFQDPKLHGMMSPSTNVLEEPPLNHEVKKLTPEKHGFLHQHPNIMFRLRLRSEL